MGRQDGGDEARAGGVRRRVEADPVRKDEHQMSAPIEPDDAATPTQMEELRQLALAAGEVVPDELPAAEAAQRLTELRALADPGGSPEPVG